MLVRRFTRLTSAHSKSQAHHAAMMAIFCGFYNYVRPHQSLSKKVTPAMAAGWTKKVWDMQTLLQATA